MKHRHLRSWSKRSGINTGLWVALCLSLIFTSFLRAQTDTSDSSAQRVHENYRIGPGDILDVTVTKNDTLSRNGLRVSNRGTIQLAMLDADITAACLTERDLADAVREMYKKYLVSPYVNVTVREFNSNPVAVIGAVIAPGRFQLQRPIRIAELMTLVNGPNANAGRTIEIMRNSARPYCDGSKFVVPEEGGDELLSTSLTDALRGIEAANLMVRAGDIIRVPEAGQMNAYIQGHVKSGAIVNLKDPVSLTQAIAMAGGLSPGAETEKIRIRRQIGESINREEIIVNFKEITRGSRDDLLLRANDIVEVPGPSGAKKVFQDIFRSIVPMVTQLPTRVIY